jgi:predicted RNase H-like HicB family nuclease
MKLQVHIRKGIEGVQAFCPELPGCSATGSHEAEALRRLRERISRCLAPSTNPLPGTRVVQIEV